MSNEIITHDQMGSGPAEMIMGQQIAQLGAGANVGSVAIEQQRAIAEAQGQLILAKKFPRNLNAAYAELMEACKLPALAEVAFYSLPRSGSVISGPSIRLAEEIARVYGNFQYGHRELSRDSQKSEVEVYAWDMEKNNYSKRQLTVMHVMDTKQGPRKLRDQKDIDDKIANVASKQVRGRILALVPKWLSEAAIAECRKTLAGNNDIPIGDRVRKMTQAFAKYGVTTKHLEAFLKHGLDETTTEDITDLQGVFNAIKDGAKISDFFGDADDQPVNVDEAERLTQVAQKGVEQRKQEEAAAKAAAPQRTVRKTAAKSAANDKLDEKAKADPAESEAKTEPASKPANEPVKDPSPEPESNL
ncbi:MAG: hypothetical protein ACRCUB_12635, partial [Plesiomonas shigelloides]